MSKYPYADKLAKIKEELIDLGLSPEYYKEYSGVVSKEYIEKKLPATLKSLLAMIDRGVFPCLNFTDVKDVAMLSMIKERNISSYVKKIIEKFESEHGLIVLATSNQCLLDTDKRYVNFKSIGETLQKIVASSESVS